MTMDATTTHIYHVSLQVTSDVVEEVEAASPEQAMNAALARHKTALDVQITGLEEPS
jgi:hypothetical protein